MSELLNIGMAHAWAEQSRGDLISGADWRLCGHCGQAKDSPIHKP